MKTKHFLSYFPSIKIQTFQKIEFFKTTSRAKNKNTQKTVSE